MITHQIRTLFVFIFAVMCVATDSIIAQPQPPPLAVTGAAGFAVPVAPDSIATAFGAQLAPRTESAATVPLPTTLAGTMVEVNGVSVGLFFVSPGQINFLVPATTATGTANITVRTNNVIVAAGVVSVQAVAPGIFCANANGRGAPAAAIYRGAAPPTSTFECVIGRSPFCLPRPIDLCAASGQVVLVLYGTGIRRASDPNNDGNLNESIRVVVGGIEVKPDFAGAQPDLFGLDQVNVVLPSSLANRGIVSLSLTAPGNASSNGVELDCTSTGSLQVAGFNPSNVVAGQVMAVQGTGFSTVREKNVVRILGNEVQTDAQVVDATANQLTVLVPFGVQSGLLSVTNLDGQCGAGTSTTPLAVKTSLSGFVKDTQGRKLKGVTVKVTSPSAMPKMETTNDEGSFIVADLAPGFALIEIDGRTAQGPLPYPIISFKRDIAGSRDNQLPFPVTLQANTGMTANLSAEGKAEASSLSVMAPLEVSHAAIQQLPPPTLTVPPNATIRFPDGTPVSRVTLTLVTRSLTPAPLPERHFSSTIVQIAPIGATISPGAKLTFPNSDAFPANASVKLFRLDQQPDSETLGEFVEVVNGAARVSSDGQRIETAADAVRETTYYFVSLERTTVTVVGNVVEDDRSPVRRALIGSRGRSGFTDGNGGFVVRSVPVNTAASLIPDGTVVRVNESGVAQIGADLLSVEANFMRPTKIVSRKENNNVSPGSGNITSAGLFVLDPQTPNNPPTILAPPSHRILTGSPTPIEFLVTRGSGQSVTVSLTGASFATIAALGNDIYRITLTPTANDRGSFTLVVTALNDLGQVATWRIALIVE